MPNDKISEELKKIEEQNALEKYKTALKKLSFIKEIKSGLGEEIKNNPKAKAIKKSRYQRFKLFLKNMFTKF